MFCRCRYLRTPHLESLLPASLPSIPTRSALRAVSTSRTLPQTPTEPSPSPHDEKVLDDKVANAPDINSLLGSIHSPLAFKPLPSVTRDNFPPDEGTYLGPELEVEPSPLAALHTKYPLLPYHRSSPETPDTAEDVGGVEEPSIPDSKDPPNPEFLPWPQHVKRLKIEKFHRQVSRAIGFRDPIDAVREWEHIRVWDRFQMANLSLLQWTLLAKAGCLLSDPSVLFHLPAELVDAHENSPKAQHSMVVRMLGKLLHVEGRKFTKHPMFDPLLRPWDSNYFTVSELEASFYENLDSLLIDLFSEYYQDKPTLVVRLPPDIIFHLATIAAYRYPQALNHGGLLSAFFSAARLHNPKMFLAFPLRNPEPLDNAPTGHVWALFRLVQVYINSDSRHEAFRLFQRLVREKIITPSAISKVKINQDDPRTAVLFAITKTCLDYEWNTGALELMILAAEHDPTIFDEQMGSLVNETLHVLLKQATLMSPAQKYSVRMSTAVQQKSAQRTLDGPKFLLRRIMALVTALRRNRQAFEIEDMVIQNFYAVARQLDFHHIAEVLFSIGRIYTPPSISAPSMLVSPSFAVSGDPSSRHLLPVKPHHLIYKSAQPPTSSSNDPQSEHSSGHLPTATTQYPVPRGPSLLWLFEAMLKKSYNVHLCRCFAKEVAKSNIDIPVYDRGHFIRLAASVGFARVARELWDRYSEDEGQGVVGHAGAMIRLVSLFYHLGQELEAKEAMIDEGPETAKSSSVPSSDPDELVDDGGDLGIGTIEGEDADVLFDVGAAKGFAKEVAERFRACKTPIQTASQQDLNALARAYFVMDRPEEGFALFKAAKAASHPDIYDVNVGLSSVAKYNVQLASRMVDRMLERGLVPDPITWGTLIHLASLKGDMGLVISLVERAQRRGISKFSSRTINSLIRASLSDVPPGSQVPKLAIALGRKSGVGLLELTLGGGGDVEQIRQNLDMAFHLIGTFDTQTFVGTGSLAKFCLDQALRLGDAELAFRFWDNYLRSKAQWSDPDQVKYRKKIYELVGEGRLGSLQRTRMLRKLSGTSERDALYHGDDL